MAQPRLKCLNGTRQVARRCLGAREFSQSSIARNEDRRPRRSSAAADLLSSLTPPPRSSETAGILAAANRASSSPHPATAREAPREDILGAFARGSVRTAPSTAAQEGILRLMAQSSEKLRYANSHPSSKPNPAGTTTAEQLTERAAAQGLTKQITRRWKPGDLYAPKDLSAVEMAKWKKRGRPERDVFDVLQLDPMEHYKNFSIMSEYMTPMGRIKHGSETGLRPVNQRRIARAIRRAVGLGIMPSVHRHPEILMKMRTPAAY